MSAPAQPPARYRIRIRGHLDPAWSAWFDSLTDTQLDDGTTELAGPVELGRDEGRLQAGEDDPVDRARMDVALNHDPGAGVAQHEARGVVAL